MKRHPGITTVQVYAMLHFANASYLRLNRVVSQFKYEISLWPLDRFENNFRSFFGLAPLIDQPRDKTIHWVNEKNKPGIMCITPELYEILNRAGPAQKSILQCGYVLLLEKSFLVYTNNTTQLLNEEVPGLIDTVKIFGETLERYMRIAQYGSFSVAAVFAVMPVEKKLVLCQSCSPAPPGHSPLLFNEKDGYFIKLMLHAEQKLQDSTRQAAVLYAAALAQKDSLARFSGLLQALEVCLLDKEFSAANSFDLAKYMFALVPGYWKDFLWLERELRLIGGLKAKISNAATTRISEMADRRAIAAKANWLEKIVPVILKKRIRLNHYEKEKLLAKLATKFGSVRNDTATR